MKKSMKQIINRGITQGAILALAMMVILVFISQWTISARSLNQMALARLADAKERLIDSKQEIVTLTDQLNEEYLIKARTIAKMIALHPALLDDGKELSEICTILDVDEIHVIDENGFIKWTTIPDYEGFDMGSSDQAKPFLKCISDDSFELAQEPQPNGARGILFQYIGVSRKDQPGAVQIGMEPVRLSEALANSQPDIILRNITVGTNGFVFAVNKSDNTLAAFIDQNLIGEPASSVGIDSNLLSAPEGKSQYAHVNGKMYFSSITQTSDYYIGTLIPVIDITQQTVLLTIIMMLMTIIVIFLLAWFINRMMNRHIIQSLSDIENTLASISGGNTERRVEVRNCREFDMLSRAFNEMLQSLETQMVETNNMNHSMEHLLTDIFNTSQSINSYSNEMKAVSEQITQASSAQETTVSRLNEAFRSIEQDVRNNARFAGEASTFSKAAGEQLKTGVEKMNGVQDAMKQITDYSQKINAIVKTIDDIAFQTNILALNASVEAARAGTAGKGFAVVADEVRNLANKSAEAAENTAKLISETLQAVQSGNVTANSAAEELQNIMESINQSIALIVEISEASAKQAEEVIQTADDMGHISDIARSNSRISFGAKEIAEKLDSEAEKLIDMVQAKGKKKARPLEPCLKS